MRSCPAGRSPSSMRPWPSMLTWVDLSTTSPESPITGEPLSVTRRPTASSRKLPWRVYRGPASVMISKKPSPSMARSSGLRVGCSMPGLKSAMRSMRPGIAVVIACPAPVASTSWNGAATASSRRYPVVEALARFCPITFMRDRSLVIAATAAPIASTMGGFLSLLVEREYVREDDGDDAEQLRADLAVGGQAEQSVEQLAVVDDRRADPAAPLEHLVGERARALQHDVRQALAGLVRQADHAGEVARGRAHIRRLRESAESRCSSTTFAAAFMAPGSRTSKRSPSTAQPSSSIRERSAGACCAM